MSILIKGMELPECCDKCPFKSYVGVDHLECKITGYRFYVWEVGWGDGTENPYIRHGNCPLVEAKDNHDCCPCWYEDVKFCSLMGMPIGGLIPMGNEDIEK